LTNILRLKIHINKVLFLFSLAFIIFNFSCGKNRQSQSNLLESTDEGERYAASHLGKDASVLGKGDLNGNGHYDILAVIVNKKEDEGKYWIQKGGIFENDNGWNTILNIDKKISSTKGNLVEQAEADHGYIISFALNEKPMTLTISIADSTGKCVSDEAELKWNQNENAYDFISNPGSVENNTP
jgi:hypothetical protein